MTSERSTQRHNLPAPVSSFIGREQELREIGQLLGNHRLITLTGTGGTGKTRLALQAATAERDHFSDGVWLIDLAPLAASELVLETIAKVLTLPAAPGPSPIERLGVHLEACWRPSASSRLNGSLKRAKPRNFTTSILIGISNWQNTLHQIFQAHSKRRGLRNWKRSTLTCGWHWAGR
jgi:hypothetical protein